MFANIFRMMNICLKKLNVQLLMFVRVKEGNINYYKYYEDIPTQCSVE